MYRIGYRTLKTAIGTAISVSISIALGLTYYTSSGIITILCIQNTRRKSLKSAFSRLIACNMSLIFASIFFKYLGFHPWVIGLFLLLFIPLTVTLKIQEGVVTSSVIMFHIFLTGETSLALIWNEFQLIIIGIGVALLANLYMPSLEKNLFDYQNRIEKNFKMILLECVHFLRHQERLTTKNVLKETGKTVQQAKLLAAQSVENDLIHSENWYFSYFSVRDKQLAILERIFHLSETIEGATEQRLIIARYLETLALSVNSGNTSSTFLQELQEMREHFDIVDLPTTRKEFIDRANLFQLLNELEVYLNIKKEWSSHNKEEFHLKDFFIKKPI